MAESYPISREEGKRICLDDTSYISIIAAGKEARAPGELRHPYGVAIHEDTHQIFVADYLNDRVMIFSETGEFIYQLGVGQLSRPYGIAIHGDSLYVSCGDDTISKYSLTEMCRVRRVGCKGSNNGQFTNPRQLTTDLVGRVFIPDARNNRICTYDPNLNHLHNITHQNISLPSDVKVSCNRVYVLCPYNNPIMLVLTIDRDMQHSFIHLGAGRTFFFCLDPLNNFVICDKLSHSIRVFSPEGNLLRTIRKEGHQQGMFYCPSGVAITPNGSLVYVSWKENYGLRIFTGLFVDCCL